MLKTLKCSMDAEYSRELSVKVFSGQCRPIELGFRQGGPGGYGLRRQLIDRNRAPKGLLDRGGANEHADGPRHRIDGRDSPLQP